LVFWLFLWFEVLFLGVFPPSVPRIQKDLLWGNNRDTISIKGIVEKVLFTREIQLLAVEGREEVS